MNICLVLDKSGSMKGTKMNAVKLGICAIVSMLQKNDYVKLITFDHDIEDNCEFLESEMMREKLPSIL